MPSSPQSDDLTIVVPVRNSSRTIARCLESVLECVPNDKRQVLVVDNGSTDGTLDVVRRFPVEVHQAPVPFVSASRNAGAARARYETIAFIDSDCAIGAGWYEATCDALSGNRVGIAGCRYALRDDANWVEQSWYEARPLLRADIHDVEYVPGGNLAVRLDVFRQLGGFDERLETGEDMDLCIRAAARGLRVVQAPSMRCVHFGEPKTLRAVFRRNRWHGRGARVRYANGRLSFVTLSTLVFVGSILTGVAGLALGLWSGNRALSLATLLPLIVPGAYALLYSKRPRPRHFVQLLLIYLAYFFGRAAALPAAAGRLFSR